MGPTPIRPAVALIAALPLSPLGSLAATPALAQASRSPSQATALSPAEARVSGDNEVGRPRELTRDTRAIAKEAWLYAYAPLQGYQPLWNQTQNKAFPG